MRCSMYAVVLISCMTATFVCLILITVHFSLSPPLFPYIYTHTHVNVVRQILSKMPRPTGLFYNFVNPRTGSWCGQHAGLSGLADSFYEYLLKEWIRTDHADTQARQMYDEGLQALLSNGLFKQSAAGHLYLGSYHHGTVSSVMDHLACFAGGMLVLGSSGQHDPWFSRGLQVTDTCRLSYESTATHLGPESFEFGKSIEAVPIKKAHKAYLLRPETVESYFYLWRFTKNPIYREWAWDMFQALKTHTNTSSGYSGLVNVNSLENNWDDVQQSYFLAETLKYLYLIFSEDTLFPLDRWVFNSEAHPLPVHNRVILSDIKWSSLPLPPQPPVLDNPPG
ncbi:unnamed protein product [Echinostoma caproni]|uniref:Alpha-1,2-Mannosidase n=1 Tax=Echinostoma caproni TaxID=27848 RepID=A0A183AHM0_9TREM|nr:unnamed protein product [Echinostoma caproni]